MYVEVRDRFPAIRPVIDDYPKPRLAKALAPGNLRGGQQEFAQHTLFRAGRCRQPGNRLFRHDENMSRCRRMNIPKGDPSISLRHHVGR